MLFNIFGKCKIFKKLFSIEYNFKLHFIVVLLQRETLKHFKTAKIINQKQARSKWEYFNGKKEGHGARA